MFKTLLAAAIVSSMTFVPGVASAQHIQTNSNPLVLSGKASLGNYRCLLTLTAVLADSHGGHTPAAYNQVVSITGTNTPDPSPECDYIEILSGSATIGSGGTINIIDLEIDSPLGTCHTSWGGPVAATVSNVGTQVKVDLLDLSNVCGPIAASLTSAVNAQYIP